MGLANVLPGPLLAFGSYRRLGQADVLQGLVVRPIIALHMNRPNVDFSGSPGRGCMTRSGVVLRQELQRKSVEPVEAKMDTAAHC